MSLRIHFWLLPFTWSDSPVLAASAIVAKTITIMATFDIIVLIECNSVEVALVVRESQESENKIVAIPILYKK